ncbi:copper chaperone PCu(A)C [Croceicoccus bisphenolivorans]|uniref:copper chaperone PCu(A)C n=1 Tax=Croceicoccus bisphenolivorans TaxID=1783232 RepID=UPI0008337E62|nr:copper chaperone PCu(A)C [Croceicoccus bisphenolivorans]
MRLNSTSAALCAAACMSLALAACNSGTPDAEPTEAVDVPVAADAPAGVSLSNAEVRMPAVTGRPGAAYFSISSQEPRKIVGVSVMGAATSEMHETSETGGAMTMAKVDEVSLQPGELLSFQPGGYHVMLFDMDATIAPGGTADLTITFDNGDKASIPARVVGAGGMDAMMPEDHDMADMEGMEH